MANVRDYIKINPIDKQSNVAVGVIFPFNAEGVFYSSYTTAEQVKSNLLNVLLTEPGERFFKPRFGVGLRNYLFENITNVNALEERIRKQVEIYIPEVEITSITVLKPEDSHQLSISITYKNINNSEADTIQVNFNTDNNTIQENETFGY